MLEKTVEDHLVRRVAETGGQQRKVTWLGHKGAPDRLVHQQREHKKLRAIGFEVRVIHTKEQVDEFILEMTS